MVIKADKEGIQAIKELCDIALRAGGLQNLEGIQNILASVKEEVEE